LKELPGLEGLTPESPTLLIIDDMIAESNLKPVEEVFLRGRRVGITVIMVAQNFHALPIMIRSNATLIILKKVNSTKELKRILSEYSLDDERVIEIYDRTQKRPNDFFLIDLDTRQKNLRVRHNFGLPKVTALPDQLQVGDPLHKPVPLS